MLRRTTGTNLCLTKLNLALFGRENQERLGFHTRNFILFYADVNLLYENIHTIMWKLTVRRTEESGTEHDTRTNN